MRSLEIAGPDAESVARCETLVKQCISGMERKGLAEAEMTRIITIPLGKAGLVIGKKGATIKLLTQESGASIEVKGESCVPRPTLVVAEWESLPGHGAHGYPSPLWSYMHHSPSGWAGTP